MKALGEQFGVSRERVRQILNQETGQPTKPRPKIQQELSPSDVEEILRKYSEGNSASSIGPSRAIRGILNTKGTGTRKQWSKARRILIGTKYEGIDLHTPGLYRLAAIVR